ncbi:MAG: WD40 repeat domain-containing serine/threonine-protein kinase [Planctomycetota bacterium]
MGSLNAELESMNLEEIAEDYLDRLRSGNAPSIEEYVERFPALADEIRDTLPALAAMEQLGLEIQDSQPQAPRWTAPDIEQVGDYQIVGELGRGGMGIVYEAEQQSLRRRVALKVLPRFSSDETGLARFQREARAAARLHHTNIVPVFQVGQDGDLAYYAMQLIEGQGLDAVINDLRQLPRRPDLLQVSSKESSSVAARTGEGSSGGFRHEHSDVLRGLSSGSNHGGGSENFYRSVARIGLQASDALSYAHQRGIVHRDVKPSNLLLDASGVVWVSDFGLAMTDEGQLTRTQDVLGTLRYMSPERFEHQCDARADIYALGMTLYELVVMEPAFRMADRLHLIQSIMKVEPAAPSEYDPEVPLDLETIILKAIEKEPRDRYESAEAMAEDLRRFLNDEPIEARRVKPIEKLMRWRRRNQGLAAALMAIVSLLILLVCVLGWTSIVQNDLLQLAEDRGQSLQENLYFSQMNVAGQAVSQRYGTDTIQEKLDEWKPKQAGRDLRNWEWYYLYGLSHGAEYVSEPLGNQFCWACDHSPDGKRVVNTKNAWGVQVRDAVTGQIINERKLGSARFVDWSPDGSKIAVGQFKEICSVLDSETLDTIQEFEMTGGGEGWCVAWHPNSKWLAEVREHADPNEKKKVRIHDVETGELIWGLSRPNFDPRLLAWHPDGNRLAASGYQGTVVWSFDSEDPSVESFFQGGRASWSPDGSMLAVSRADGTWDALSEKRLADSVGSIEWSPSSKRIAIGCGDGVIRIHDIEKLGAHPQRSFRGHMSEIWSMSWCADGLHLASCGLRDETFRIWRVDQSNRLQLGGDASVKSLELSGDGRSLASISYYNTEVVRRDLSGNLKTRRNFNAQISSFAVSQSGDTIAVVTETNGLVLWEPGRESIRELSSGREFLALAWNAEGELATTTKTGAIVIWDAKGQIIREIEDAIGPGLLIAWSPDAQSIATCNESSLGLWDVDSGQPIWKVSGLEQPASDIRFSNDGTRLATAQRNAIIIWDSETGEELKTLTAMRERFASVDWSSDDSRIVTGSEVSVAFWDVGTGRTTLRLDAPERLTRVRWTPDKMRVAVSGTRIVIFDATRGYALSSTRITDPATSASGG